MSQKETRILNIVSTMVSLVPEVPKKPVPEEKKPIPVPKKEPAAPPKGTPDWLCITLCPKCQSFVSYGLHMYVLSCLSILSFICPLCFSFVCQFQWPYSWHRLFIIPNIPKVPPKSVIKRSNMSDCYLNFLISFLS